MGKVSDGAAPVTGSAQQSPGRRLVELSPLVTRLENDWLARLDTKLTYRQYRILRRVAEGYKSPTAIKELATLSLPTISESVEGLVHRGLLDRSPDPDDRRRVRLEPTSAGWEALHAADAAMSDLADRLTDGIAAQHRSDVALALATFVEHVRGMLSED